MTIGDATTDVVGILNLVELATGAGEDGSGPKLVLQSGGDLSVGVSLARAWGDTGISQPLVSREILEQSDGRVEKVDKFILLGVVGIAAGVQSGVASTMLAPFVLPERPSTDDAGLGCDDHLPERLIVALVVLPIGLHVGQDVTMTLVLKNAADVGVCSRAITSSFVSAIAVVGPVAVVNMAVP